MRSRLAALGLGLSFLFVPFAAGTSAQTLYGVDGVGGVVNELTGPPAPPCAYPNGPGLFLFPYQQLVPCATMNPFLPPPGSLLGDVATNRKSDNIFVTDGKNIGEFTATGIQLNVMSVSTLGISPVTGLGYDTATGTLWMTDGGFVYAATPSPPGSCLPPTITASWVAAGLGFVTDVSWHPGTSVLFACDAAGMIGGYTAAGAVAIPPWPQAASGCALGGPLTGLAVDTSTGCTGLVPALYVTNGFTVDYQRVGGIPGPAKFYTPANCYPWSAGPTQGLAYVAHPIDYGSGTGPIIDSVGGQSVLPNPVFKITLTGGPPGGTAWLLYGTGAACPPLNFFGQPWYVSPWQPPLGPFPIPGSGNITLNAPLPPPGGAVPCGASIYMQWLCNVSPGVWRTSQGLEFTTSLP